MSQIIIPTTGGNLPPSVPTLFDGNTGTATPVANTINIVTANSIPIFAASGNTLTLDFGLTNLIIGSKPLAITSGVLNVGLGTGVLSNLVASSGCVAIGFDALNALNSALASNNGSTVAVGTASLSSATFVLDTVAIGSSSLASATSSNSNVAIGFQTLSALLTGGSNIALGSFSGFQYKSSESSNIVIGSAGVTGDSNTIRIGTQGSAGLQQNTCYIAGITGVTTTNTQMVTINTSTGQLGSAAVPVSAGGLGVYGDGSDGSVTFDGSSVVLGITPSASSYTLARDLFLGSSTINSGVKIITNGFRMFCQGTLTNNGTIEWNGATATNSTGAVSTSNSSSSLNVGTTTTAPGTAGGSGSTSTGSNGVNSSTNTQGGIGGAGGLGTNAGGAAGTITTTTAESTQPRFAPLSVIGWMLFITSPTLIQGGSGGGGGGGDGVHQGGGGGAGGGVVLLSVKTFAGTGTIEALGGGGAAGQAGSTKAGGGGGGGGGVLLITSNSISSSTISGQTLSVAGGVGGVGVGSGAGTGSTGATGTLFLVPN